MSFLLFIETATKNCSVALSHKGQCLGYLEASEAQFSHSEKLHQFILKLLESKGVSPKELSGVVVDKGPGSYTGLRIGVATAKGLCYALKIPLISLDSLEVLAASLPIDSQSYIIPMIDARRMEVYTVVFDAQKKRIKPIWAEILQPQSFEAFSDSNRCIIIGNAQEKAQTILKAQSIEYYPNCIEPSAKDMIALGTQKFNASVFEDLAYFEPFYLKEFYTTLPKNN